jgi:uncharacterized protein YjbJ (UPF0337 family)
MGINKDQVEGRAKELGGKVQEEFGKLVGDRTQEAKGVMKQAAGATQAKLGDVAEHIKETVKKTS